MNKIVMLFSVLVITISLLSYNHFSNNSGGIETNTMAPALKKLYTRNNYKSIKSHQSKKKGFYSKIILTKRKRYNYFKLINNSESWVEFPCEDGYPRMIQEAINKKGKWAPIEFWKFSTCGNSYGYCKIRDYKEINYKIRKYKGDFKTKLRIKYQAYDTVLYSPEFHGTINQKQFIKPDNVRNDQINF